jgi:acetyl-CoA synthetase
MQGSALFASGGSPAWKPTAAHLERSRLLAAMRQWGYERLEDLQTASIDDPERFWRAVVDDLEVTFATPFAQVRDESEGKPFPRWFVGGHINAATLCAHRHGAGPHAGKTAFVYEGDSGQRRSMTYAEFDQAVRTFAANLVQHGIGRGDRVVLFLPVVPEAAVAFFACAMIGATSVPSFTGFGADAVATRIRVSEAVAVVTADGTTRRGKVVPLKQVADAAVDMTTTVRSVFVVRHLDIEVPMQAGRDVYWNDLDRDPVPVEVADTESNDPLTIIYTSGTTGAPKGVVLSHGGLLVKAASDFAYGFDIHDDEVVAWISDIGWMLGPLLMMGVLQLGATLVLTEGVPNYPEPGRLWAVANRNAVTFQGIAPTAARSLMGEGEANWGSLGTVRTFASTGEAWDDRTWHWLFETVGERRRPIVNYSGGTETGGGILVGYPFLPMTPSCFNGPLPGMDVAVADQEGRPTIGQIGELAVYNTWPGMTHSFWHDPSRYLETYWKQWDGVWLHGDLASVDGNGYWMLHGRSDDTIKVSGRRVGPAEIETALLIDERIAEAAAIGVPDSARGQRIVAFVVVPDAAVDLDDLSATAVRNVGKSFAPELLVVPTLPKTKNGKIMRRAIRAQHLGQSVGDLTSLDPATPLEDIPIQTEAGERS